MNQPALTRKLLPAFVIGGLALAAGIWSSMQLSKPVVQETTAITLLPTPRQLPELTLINQDAETTGSDTFKGQWSLVFMGFTSCGHTCPMAMAEIRAIHGQLDKPATVVFFSVDPGRDNPEVLKNYVTGFDKSFTGLTGTAEEIEKFAGTLGAPYFVDENPDNYVVEHSSAVFLIDPSASLAGVISQPFDIEVIAKELNRVL